MLRFNKNMGFTRTSTMWFIIDVSNNLHRTDVKLIGRCLSYLLIDPFLNNGVIFASFHSDGTIPSITDNSRRFVFFIILMFFDFISGVTNNTLN